MEKVLSKRIMGQEEAVSAVSKAIRRARTGLKPLGRPIAAFLFADPTGVGKTEQRHLQNISLALHPL